MSPSAFRYCGQAPWIRAPLATGGTSSGGTDNYRKEDGAAWFLSLSGKTRIQVCFRIDRDFGVKEDVLRETVEASFSKWREYLHVKRWSEESYFVTSVAFLGECDGTEDLRFYFGGTSAEVEKAKQGHREPFAISSLDRYDEQAGWGRGFVWIAPPSSISPNVPNWSDPLNLKAILLHEVGHILGCDHVSGTIMAKDLAKALKYEWPSQLRATFLGQIDHEKELLECSGAECQGVISGLAREGAFPTLLKRDPIGDFRARYIKAGGNPPRYRPAGILELIDATGVHRFPVEARVLVSSSLEEDVEVFKIRHAEYKNGTMHRVASAYYGTIRLENGDTLPIILQTNMTYAMRIIYIPPTGEKAVHLFLAYGAH